MTASIGSGPEEPESRRHRFGWVTRKPRRGGASTKTDEFTIPSGVKARLSYFMAEDGNNAIELYQSPDEYVDLLLNEIGPQSGTSRLYRA